MHDNVDHLNGPLGLNSLIEPDEADALGKT